MPGTLAMVTNGGASVLGERGCGDRSTSWHSEQSCRAVVNPAAGVACAIADGPASAVAAMAIDPISLAICSMSDAPTRSDLPAVLPLGHAVRPAGGPGLSDRPITPRRVTIAFVLLLMRSRPAVSPPQHE